MWTGKSNGNSVDVNKLVPGIYLLNIVSSSKSYVSKFLKVDEGMALRIGGTKGENIEMDNWVNIIGP